MNELEQATSRSSCILKSNEKQLLMIVGQDCTLSKFIEAFMIQYYRKSWTKIGQNSMCQDLMEVDVLSTKTYLCSVGHFLNSIEKLGLTDLARGDAFWQLIEPLQG